MSSCHAQFKTGGLPRLFMKRNVEIFESDLRKWIAALAVSGWTPVKMVEEAIQGKTLCFPLAKIEINKQGKILNFLEYKPCPNKKTLERSWKITQGDPIRRGRSLEPDFINFLMENVEGHPVNEELPEDMDLDDSGIDFSPLGLQSPVENDSLNWVSEILDGTLEDEEETEDENYILVLEKRFSCALEACMEHVEWRIKAERIQDPTTLASLEDGETFISLLDKWIHILKQKHFPSVAELSLTTTVFGRREKSL